MTQQDVLELMSKRKEIENQIHQQEAILRSNNITLKEPLIDKEGFPIPDVDLYTVRDARANLIRLGNDYKAITKEIELGLHSIHGQQPMTPQLAIVPFARCDAIEPSSPAYLDGLRTGDALLE
jgi:26S proteasome non-ATPase regulatory subunit 9